MTPQTDPLDDLADDSAIDRLIQATLGVEPSPEFLTRVRAAIATATIDQEIQDDLNVDPSPEFVAQIRQRIQEDAPTHVGSGLSRIGRGFSRIGVASGFSRIGVGSGFSRIGVGSGFSRIVKSPWAVGAGALATAAVLALLFVSPVNDPLTVAPISEHHNPGQAGSHTPVRSDIALSAPSPIRSGPLAAAAVAPRELIPITPSMRVVAATPRETEPVPVATPSEIEGLRQLVAAARRGLVDDSLMALPTLDSEQPLDAVPPLSIASLSIDALDH
jgi:hypothetical protein